MNVGSMSALASLFYTLPVYNGILCLAFLFNVIPFKLYFWSMLSAHSTDTDIFSQYLFTNSVIWLLFQKFLDFVLYSVFFEFSGNNGVSKRALVYVSVHILSVHSRNPEKPNMK